MLKIGPFSVRIPENTQLRVEGQSDFFIVELDDKGNPKAAIARSSDRLARVTVRKEADILFSIAEGQFISVDARPVRSATEEVSDVPYEVPDDNQASLTLEEKLKRYLAEIVAERYGEQSNEYETFEESMDFDDEEDDPISLSGYEIPDIVSEEPIDASGVSMEAGTDRLDEPAADEPEPVVPPTAPAASTETASA